VVTSYKVEEALNFGYQELLDHDQRYDRADEYMELCAQLWSSWEPDAVVMDTRSNTYADPAKVRTIDFEGDYYRARGPLNATPSPQGRPVIIQAGTSERGQDFAAQHAEAIIVPRETTEEMKQFYDQFKARVRKFGRVPEACKIFFLAKPIIGDTDEAAQQTATDLDSLRQEMQKRMEALPEHTAQATAAIRKALSEQLREIEAITPALPRPTPAAAPDPVTSSDASAMSGPDRKEWTARRRAHPAARPGT